MQEAKDKAFVGWWHSRSIDNQHGMIYDAALDLMPNLRGAKLVDFGCGTGEFDRRAISRGVRHVTGVDHSSYALYMAERYLDERGISYARGSGASLDAQVRLIESEASDTGLDGDKYTHASFILPSYRFDQGKPVDLSEEESISILTKLFPTSAMVFDSAAERNLAKEMLRELREDPNPQNQNVLDHLYLFTYRSQVFKEAFRLLENEGYFLVVDYCGIPRLSPGILDPDEENKSIVEKIISFGDPQSYRLVSSEFVESPHVYNDVIELNRGMVNHLNESSEIDPTMFKGVQIFLIQKLAKER